MRVADLIRILQSLPRELPVYFEDVGFGDCPVTHVIEGQCYKDAGVYEPGVMLLCRWGDAEVPDAAIS